MHIFLLHLAGLLVGIQQRSNIICIIKNNKMKYRSHKKIVSCTHACMNCIRIIFLQLPIFYYSLLLFIFIQTILLSLWMSLWRWWEGWDDVCKIVKVIIKYYKKRKYVINFLDLFRIFKQHHWINTPVANRHARFQ